MRELKFNSVDYTMDSVSSHHLSMLKGSHCKHNGHNHCLHPGAGQHSADDHGNALLHCTLSIPALAGANGGSMHQEHHSKGKHRWIQVPILRLNFPVLMIVMMVIPWFDLLTTSFHTLTCTAHVPTWYIPCTTVYIQSSFTVNIIPTSGGGGGGGTIMLAGGSPCQKSKHTAV